MKHENTGACAKCQEFLKAAHPTLKSWFEKEQKADPELHVAWSTRGRSEQEAFKAAGKSKAEYGESPHNYKMSWAIDVFFQVNSAYALIWSRLVAIAKRKPAGIIWGADWNDNGRTDDEKFKDAPHFEIQGWKKLEKSYPNGTA